MTKRYTYESIPWRTLSMLLLGSYSISVRSGNSVSTFKELNGGRRGWINRRPFPSIKNAYDDDDCWKYWTSLNNVSMVTSTHVTPRNWLRYVTGTQRDMIRPAQVHTGACLSTRYGRRRFMIIAHRGMVRSALSIAAVLHRTAVANWTLKSTISGTDGSDSLNKYMLVL